MASRTTTDPIEILLEMGVDLDNLSEEEDYLSALMEAVNTLTIKDASDPRIGFLADEIRKVRTKRKAADPKFKAKKTKISADSFKKGSATTTSVGQKALPPVIEPKTSIIPYQKPDEVDEEEGGKKKARTRKKTDKDQKLLEGIAKSVSNIADILKDQYGLKKKKASYDRKKAEADKRKLKESNLEKRFQGLASTAEKIIQPVKGILDRILDFFLKIIVGRFLVKLIGWFGDPKNAKKVDSVVRFLTDHGPKLLAAFLLFGTGIGRFAVRLSAVLLKGALRLGAAAAKFALGFARRHPAAAAITAIVGGAAIAGAMNKKDDAGSDGAVPPPGPGAETETRVAGQKYDPNNPTELQQKALDMSAQMGNPTPSMEEGGFVPNFFGMAKGAGSSIKEKGFGNAALDFAGGALGGVKNFMDEKGISDVLMAHPLAKLGLLGFDKGKELLGGLTDHLNKTGLTDILMQHPLAKMGAFGLDKFMNFGKDPARDITGESGKDVTGAGVDTQLISARPGDFVVNKKTADAMGPDYFDAISTDTGEKVSGAGPDTQMIAVRPGEIVVNRETVNALGPDHFLGLNRLFGGAGANKPKMAKVQSASNGGFVLPAFSAGGYVSGTDTGKRGTPDPEKKESSGGAGPSMGYRLGQINPMQDLRAMEKVVEKVVDRELRGGQGGRKLGSTTQRGGEGTKIYKDGHLVTSYDKYGRKKEYGKPEGFMRALAGVGDLLTGNLFDFDRRNEKNVGVSETRITTKDFLAGREYTSDTTTSQIMSAIGRPDLIKHQDQILKQLPKGTTIQDVIKGNVSGVTPEKLATILATSDAQKATRKKQDNARRLDLAIRGIGEKDGVSMMAGDMTPALQQAEATANKRHAELMKSTNPERIAAYDKKHGEGAYSQKLKEKLYRTYGGQATGQTQPSAPTPTGKVVGRENLSPQAQAAIARLESKKGLPPDMQYTRNGKKISAEEFNRVKSGNIIPGGGKPGGFLGGMMEGAKNILGGMFKPGETKTIFRDGNIGTPTAEEQKAIDRLNANRARADKREAESKAMMNRPKKSVKDDPLFAEYQQAFDNPNHPLHAKVAGDLFDDTGTKDPLRFEDFKKLKAQQSQAKLSLNQPSPAAPPPPPAGGGSNVKVVRMPSPNKEKSVDKQSTGGSDVDAVQTGNGNKAKWNILGIPMPF